MSGRRLHPLKIEKMLPARLKVADIQRADDFLSIDHVAGIDGAACCRRSVAGGCSDCCRQGRNDKTAAVKGEGGVRMAWFQFLGS